MNMRIYYSAPRRNRRKFARLLTTQKHFIKGYIIGGAMVGLLVAAGMARAQSTNQNCGGTSQPRCEVVMPVDAAMTSADMSAREAITQANNQGKSLLENIDPDKFKWTFIPQIPTAECQNLTIQSPIGGNGVEMDVCSPFNTFKVFMNGVLAVLCLIGSARQIQSALRA